MAALTRVKDLVDAELNGQVRYYTWRKSPTQATTARVWFDLSMSPGNPVPQYYAASPLNAVLLKQSTDGGLFHGANVSPATKYLRSTTALTVTATALPMPMLLCDYLLYYPFIDEGTTDEQVLNNNTAALSRYTDGAGVQVMAVSVASRIGGKSFYINYTNSNGVSGRISKTVIQNSTATANGSIVTTDGAVAKTAGPFIPLQEGDTGVRSIQSVTMLGSDVGLFTLVLVKPLVQTQIRGIDAVVEVDYFTDRAEVPIIQDDAYLSWLCLPQGALNATALHGDIKVVWN